MSAQPARQPDELPTTQAELLELALADCSKLLGDVYRQLPLLQNLADSRQPGLTFTPAATRAQMGKQFLADRFARRQAEAAGLPAGKGATAAPGNVSGWALVAEIEMTLRHLIRFIVRHDPESAIPVPDEGETTGQLVNRFRTLLWTVTQLRVARAIQVDLRHLAELAGRLLDGEDRTALAAECPHCRNRTLVVYLHSGVIRCERPRRADGTRATCQCQHPICPCRTERRFVHSWVRESNDPVTSWGALAGRLTLAKHLKETP
ncbi:MAG TPA: hypothetical protein VMF51_18100 [Nocardioides sp.]|uniref:hypothetical protein n=1 Tax=Nocardioides sp. TaxID=35761 RepID=UPI002CA0CB38|nr:hypothetical protein [Nocardioides sp.]HTW17048.1 hypothetical protein [Nocardioides sp.]